MAFVIDRYNKYDAWDREHQVYVFEVNGQEYAVMRVEMEWGIPQIGCRVDTDQYGEYQVYERLEDAMKFVHTIRKLN